MCMQSIPKALENIQDNSTSYYNSSLLREIMNYNKSNLKLFQNSSLLREIMNYNKSNLKLFQIRNKRDISYPEF